MIGDALGFALAVLLAVLAVWAFGRLTTDGFSYSLERFWRDRRNVPFGDQQAELTLRTAAARLRRIASQKVIAERGDPNEIIEAAANAEARALAGRDPALAREFVDWANNAPMRDILYPAALQVAYRRALAKVRNVPPSQDLIAALRIR